MGKSGRVWFGNWDYWKIAPNVVIGDKTDTDVELVVIIQTEQENSGIKLMKPVTLWNSQCAAARLLSCERISELGTVQQKWD